MKPVDSHCHIDFEQFDEDREEIIEECRNKLEFAVNSGSTIEHNKAALKLEKQHPEVIKANIGLHPVYTEEFSSVDKVKQQISENNPVAIGEIGLDHYHVKDSETRNKQEEVFREMLETAEKLGKPVVIHSRDAERKAVNIIKEYNLPNVFLHCFNGSKKLAEHAANKGMFIGVTTQVLYAENIQELVKSLELSNIVLETDSPYLYKNGRNKPVNVVEVAEKISDIKSVETKKVIEQTTENSKKIFCR